MLGEMGKLLRVGISSEPLPHEVESGIGCLKLASGRMEMIKVVLA